ncbi:alpha/beta fold hydrolase [Nocardia sp. NPDC052566]|uniref:alpha/beta fold hydrolase n=1 Tax=Nocardia sp. NPDC052566 TaxID=3364330 RepID=UPI0037CA894A
MRRASVTAISISAAITLLAGHAAAESGTYDDEFQTPRPRIAELPLDAPAIPSAIAGQSLDWKPCAGTGLGAAVRGNPYAAVLSPMLSELDCATVRTPLDWSRPETSPEATFEISRLRSRNPNARQLLTSPGGLGAGMLLNPIQWAGAFPQLRDTYDLIGFDPRGTGLSSTNQDCDADLSGDPNLLATGRNDRTDVLDFAADSVRRQLGRARDWVRSCLERGARTATGEPTAGSVNYWQTVRDLDLARTLLGAPSWSFLGRSQGTLLGLELARTFPDRLDRLVLDSAVGPTLSQAQIYTERILRQQRALENSFAPWLAKRGSGFGDTTEAVLSALTTLRADLTTHPIPLPFDRTFSGNDLNMLFLGIDNGPYEGLERKLTILRAAVEKPAIATQLNAAMAFRVSPMVELIGQDISLAGSRVGWWTARSCNSTGWSHDLDEIVSAAQELAKQAPLTYTGMGFTAVCVFWPEAQTGTSAGGYDRIRSALLLGNEKDPVTTISGAETVRTLVRDARLVTVAGKQAHTVLPQIMPGGVPGSTPGTSGCANAVAAAYLLDGRLPDTDTVCQPG